MTEDPMELTQAAQRDTSASRADARTAAAAGAMTLGLAGACWAAAVRQMSGMNMGTSTRLGSFAFFAGLWVLMMAAMMLPGAVPAVVRFARTGARTGARAAAAVPVFLISYLAVWAAVGVVVYAVYRPHGTVAAGLVVIAAGLYELTPAKRRCRARCRESTQSGLGFGLCCVGSSIGLMLVLVAVGVMSIAWMAVIAVVVVAQKLLPARAVLDVPAALAITALGVLIMVAPSSVPGLLPPM
jgi:predicted metal-binding membrane protein